MRYYLSTENGEVYHIDISCIGFMKRLDESTSYGSLFVYPSNGTGGESVRLSEFFEDNTVENIGFELDSSEINITNSIISAYNYLSEMVHINDHKLWISTAYPGDRVLAAMVMLRAVKDNGFVKTYQILDRAFEDKRFCHLVAFYYRGRSSWGQDLEFIYDYEVEDTIVGKSFGLKALRAYLNPYIIPNFVQPDCREHGYFRSKGIVRDKLFFDENEVENLSDLILDRVGNPRTFSSASVCNTDINNGRYQLVSDCFSIPDEEVFLSYGDSLLHSGAYYDVETLIQGCKDLYSKI